MKNRLPLALLLMISSCVVTWVAGATGLNAAKIAGLGLALVAFMPVFVLLKRSMNSGTPNEVLGTFVGGFFYKLVVLIAGVWWGIARSGYPMIDFSVACLSFLFSFQILESLYFAGRKTDAN